MSPAITLTIDGKTISAKKGQTILEAAGQNQVSIPHLCAYEGLEPFAACRLCIVEVEGMRGFPAACSTPVGEGMVVRTQTSGVQALRRETLELILTEHPSNCLFCEEAAECGAYMTTLRKGEAVTGCRSCPKDNQCELQEVVNQVGLSQVNLPVHYRNLPVEKFDPFYDRDYNLCILCGRCVRVCQDVRLADVLTFKQRGQATLIGPAFERSHLDAGCEFCGACVAACPTGALSEKTLKWAGAWEEEIETTCVLCSLGCPIRLLVGHNEVMGSLPVDDQGQSATPGQLATPGQMCVKGRFSTFELLNNPQRLRQPLLGQQEIEWEKAIDLAVTKLSACDPTRFSMVVSPDCTSEDLYVAQKFTRQVMSSKNISSRVPQSFGQAFEPYARLMDETGQLASLKNAATILTIGLDGRFGWSVVGLELKKAVKSGARLFMALPYEPHLANFAESWLPLDGQTLASALQKLARLVGKPMSASSENRASSPTDRVLESLANALRQANSPAIVIGPEYLDDPFSRQILEGAEVLAAQVKAVILPLAPQSNLASMLRIERMFEHLPVTYTSSPVESSRLKPVPISGEIEREEVTPNAGGKESGAKDGLQVLYLVGETPDPQDPPASFVIYQNFSAIEGPTFPDLSLPAAAFAEVDGSTINLEGAVRELHKAVEPPGSALADWAILCRIAQKMGFAGFDYPDAQAIRREIENLQNDYREGIKDTKENEENLESRDNSSIGIHLTTAVESSRSIQNESRNSNLVSRTSSRWDRYRGFPLTTWVEGLKILD